MWQKSGYLDIIYNINSFVKKLFLLSSFSVYLYYNKLFHFWLLILLRFHLFFLLFDLLDKFFGIIILSFKNVYSTIKIKYAILVKIKNNTNTTCIL